MKKFCLYVVFVLICALMTAPALAGEIVIYPDEFPPKTLQSVDFYSLTDVVAPSNTEPTDKSPSLTGNNVTINSGLVKNVAGAVNLISGDTDPIISNEVFIKGDTVNYEVWGGIGYDCDVVGNIVTVSDGTVSYVYGGTSISANSTGNIVIVSDGFVNWIEGGRGDFGSSSGNKVTITGGTIGGVVGGFSIGNPTPGTPSNSTGNEVTITGGSVSGNVEGGRIHYGDAINNTVNISGNPAFHVNTIIRGGISTDGRDGFTGNTLNLTTSVSVWEVENFENYEFVIPASVGNGDALITVTANPTNISGTSMDIKGIAAGSTLANGNTITLISNVTGAPDNINGVPYAPDTDIVTSRGIWRFSTSTGALTATVVSLTGPVPKKGGGGGCNAFGSLGILTLAGLIFTRRW